MRLKKTKLILFSLLVLIAFILLVKALQSPLAVVLHPKGWIGLRERHFMAVATWLMLIVVIPVFILTFWIAWKYRASNKARHDPDWDHSHLAEGIWWGIPCVIILFLSIITWKGNYEVDPFKPLSEEKPALTIQVIAMQWKWLFIYPEQKIATINFVQFPEKTPIHFEITADAPMNSFWIPQLGGQIYAMPGMKTQLNLIADEPGQYRGSSANLSGWGFSSMKFVAKSSSETDFSRWVEHAQEAPVLNRESYKAIAVESADNPETLFSLGENDLYEEVIMKYMMPGM